MPRCSVTRRSSAGSRPRSRAASPATYSWLMPCMPNRRMPASRGDLPVQGVRRGGGRQAGEPRRVEDRHLRQVGPRLPGQPDAGQRGRVVQGRELGEVLQLAQRRRRRAGSAAVNRLPPCTTRWPTARRSVRRRPPAPPRRPARRPPRDRSRRAARPSRGRWPAAPGIDHPVLQRRRAGVEDQDAGHGASLPQVVRTGIEPRTPTASGADGSCGSEDYRSTGWDFT